MMVLHVRRVLECNERNPGLRGDSVELCSMRIVRCAPKVSQCPTSVRNGKAYEYISMDNIQLI